MTLTAPSIQPAIPPPDISTIYRLADQLDATLAIGEDLLRLTVDVAAPGPGDANAAIVQRHEAIADFARAARALELAMTARLLQARARAVEIRDTHQRFSLLIGLFIGGTAPLADAAAGLNGGLGDVSASALAGGPDIHQFLQSRAVIDATVRSLAQVTTLACREDYLLAAQIHLGTLLDMIAQFLDSLDLAFDLYAQPRRAQDAT